MSGNEREFNEESKDIRMVVIGEQSFEELKMSRNRKGNRETEREREIHSLISLERESFLSSSSFGSSLIPYISTLPCRIVFILFSFNSSFNPFSFPLLITP
jgi:hypothetical protein